MRERPFRGAGYRRVPRIIAPSETNLEISKLSLWINCRAKYCCRPGDYLAGFRPASGLSQGYRHQEHRPEAQGGCRNRAEIRCTVSSSCPKKSIDLSSMPTAAIQLPAELPLALSPQHRLQCARGLVVRLRWTYQDFPPSGSKQPRPDNGVSL